MSANKRKILESARKHAQKGSRDKALKEYEKLLKLDPRDAKLRLEIGDAYRRWGQVEEAITAYTKVAEQYMAEGFDARAVAVFKQIQNLDPGRWSSYLPLAELYQRMGLNSEAIQTLQTAADGLHREGKKTEALGLLRQMASLDPSNTVSRIKVGDLLQQEGMSREAVAEYREAHAELERQGETEAAANVLQRILEIEPNDVQMLGIYARAQLALGDLSRAEPAAQRALELEPDEPVHWELNAEIYKALGRAEDAARCYRGLAERCRERGDEDRARDIMQRFGGSDEFGAPAQDLLDGMQEDPSMSGLGVDVPLEPEEPTLLEEAILDTPLDDDGPVEVLEPVTDEMSIPEDLAPPAPAAEPPPAGDPEQLLAEASVYLRYGKRPQAIRNLNAVLARDPKHRGALEKLGEAHADGGDPVAAVKLWLRAAAEAVDAGDVTGAGVLRDRIHALDPAAAERVGPLAEPEGAAEPELETEPGLESTELADLPGVDDLIDDGADVELELDTSDFDEGEDDLGIDVDVDVDIAAPSETAADDGGYDLSDEVEIELDDDLDSTDGDHAVAGERSEYSAAKIQEAVDEAAFYREQGLLDEAEAIYRRILDHAPNHPTALVLIGEIEAARGAAGDVGTPSLETEAPTLEPPDEIGDWDDEAPDLDLGEPEPAASAPVLSDTAIDFDAQSPDDDESDLLGETPAAAPIAAAPGDEDLSDLGLDGDEAPALALEPAATEEAAGGGFDLAAELSDVFDEDDAASSGGGTLGSISEQDVFASVFAEFKKGVSDALEDTDHEAHYDLGIAYREMGLMEDAIAEFRTASASTTRRVESLHLTGLCLLDLGRSEEAVGQLQEALSVPSANDAAMLAARFELGRAYEALGRIEEARDAWQAVAAVDPGFCEVEERIARLGGEKPEETEAQVAGGDLESFEDLFTDDEADGAPARAPEAATPAPDPEPTLDPDVTEPDTDGAPKVRRKRKISFL